MTENEYLQLDKDIENAKLETIDINNVIEHYKYKMNICLRSFADINKDERKSHYKEYEKTVFSIENEMHRFIYNGMLLGIISTTDYKLNCTIDNIYCDEVLQKMNELLQEESDV